MAGWDPLDQEAARLALDASLDPAERQAQVDALYTPAPMVEPAPSPLANTAGMERPESLASMGVAGPGTGGPDPSSFLSNPAGSWTVPASQSPQDGAAEAERQADMYSQQLKDGGVGPTGKRPAGTVDPGTVRLKQPGGGGGGGGGGAPGGGLPIDPALAGLLAPTPVRRHVVGSNTFVPVSQQTSIQKGLELDPELEAQREEARMDREDAAETARRRQAEVDRQVLEQANAREADRAQLESEQREREADRQQRAATMENQVTGFMRDIETMQAEKIDPNRFWDNRSTGDRIMAGIAVGLGALGSALTGAPNVAWERLQQMAEADLMAQKENYQRQRQSLGDKMTASARVYDMAMQRFDDERIAEQAAKVAMQEDITRSLAMFADSIDDPVKEAQYRELEAMQREKELAAKQQLHMEIQDKATVQTAERFDPRRTVVTGGGPNLKQLKEVLGIQKDINELRKGQAGTAGDPALDLGAYGVAIDDSSAKVAREAIARQRTLEAAAADLAATINNRGGMGTAEWQRLVDSKSKAMAMKLAKVLAGGKTTEQDEKTARDILGNATDWTTTDTGALQKLGNVVDMGKTETEQVLSTYTRPKQ